MPVSQQQVSAVCVNQAPGPGFWALCCELQAAFSRKDVSQMWKGAVKRPSRLYILGCDILEEVIRQIIHASLEKVLHQGQEHTGQQSITRGNWVVG